MPSNTVDVFVICDAEHVPRGNAKAFSLSRVDGEGQARPFPIFVVRTEADVYLGYVNVCPHDGLWLNVGDGEFFSEDRAFLECGRHGAKYEIDTGKCVEGPCMGKDLEPIPLIISEGEVCLCGLTLVEEDRTPDPFEDEYEETMEIMIHPD